MSPQKTSLIVVTLALLTLCAMPVHALTGTDVMKYTGLTKADQTCTFTSMSGLLNNGKVFTSGCTGGDLVAFINALDTFFYRLAIVLAVLMITIGGMQWLMAIGNSSKISNAKDTIQQAVIGLILAMTAILLFNQIDPSFTNLKSIDLKKLDSATSASCESITAIAQCLATKNCRWTPTDPTKGALSAGTCSAGDATQDGDCSGASSGTCLNYTGCYLSKDGLCASSPNICIKTAADYQSFKAQYSTVKPECCVNKSGPTPVYAWANFVLNKNIECSTVCGSDALSTEWQKGDINDCINNMQ